MIGKVIVKGFIEVPSEDMDTVLSELPCHIALTREEEGCLIFEVNPDLTDKNRFNVYEEFRDKAAFEIHQERVKNSRWGEVSKNVLRHYS